MQPSNDETNFMFFWNPKTRTVLGRDKSSWAKIGLFYVVFYAFLAAFFSVLMAVFFQTIDYNSPKLTGTDSLLVNPGLGFRPLTYNEDDLRPTITYDPSDCVSSAYYVRSIETFLKLYETTPPYVENCLPEDGFRVENGPVCNFDIRKLNTSCSSEDKWGYFSNSPCIFLKLNKMFHWIPKPLKNLSDLPEALQVHINASENSEETLKQNLWVWCESKNVEIEQLSPGLPIRYFPYHNQKGYLAPFVAVRLLNITAGLQVEVRCRVWADNVPHKLNGRRIGEARIFFNTQ